MGFPPTPTPQAKAEQRIRLLAFKIAYDVLYASQGNLIRFVRAILYSASPIRDPKLILLWDQWTDGKTIRQTLASGAVVPVELRPLVNAWRESRAARRAFDGED